MAKVRVDNPGLSDADLMVKVSDRVKQAEDARKGRAGVEAQAFPYHMVGEQLRRAPMVPPVPAPPAHLNGIAANVAPADRYVHPHPVIPAMPAMPAMPAFPAFPAIPAMPAMPAMPTMPAFGYPVQPFPFYQHLYPAQPVQPMGFYGAIPQQPYQPYIQRPMPMIAPCPRCHFFHPPNQYC